MTGLWVDTDMGFDDLWALLLLRRLGMETAGVSLLAGNAPLPRVVANARGAAHAYGLRTPLYAGAAAPLHRTPETAEQVLGPRGMRSRGRHLPAIRGDGPLPDAVSALAAWLESGPLRTVLALGPLTNLATLIRTVPAAARNIGRLVWMGGSSGPGNHSAHAEFNALADPEAAEIVAGAGLPFDVVDLTLCRRVTFGQRDMPPSDPLTSDLLAGYMDIALGRGRNRMAIYDPVAALAAVQPELFRFEPVAMDVSTAPGEHYGATRFRLIAGGPVRLAIRVTPDAAAICLGALAEGAADAT